VILIIWPEILLLPSNEPSAAEESFEQSEGDMWVQNDVALLDDDTVQPEDLGYVDYASQLDDNLQLGDDDVQLDDVNDDDIQRNDDNVQFCNVNDDVQLDDPVQFDGHMQFDNNMLCDEGGSSEGLEDSPTFSEEEADDEPQYDHVEPLYPGAAITVGMVMTLLLAFIVRHKLTNEAILDLLYSGSSVIRTPLYQASEKSVQISEFVQISKYARFYYYYS